jgi:hypothetical protein
MRFVDDFSWRYEMTCEEFASAGLDLDSSQVDELLQKAAREHLRECPRCAALQENWLALREDLRSIGAETADVETPARVEMHLQREFVAKHKTVKEHRSAVIWGWSLAAAATLLFAINGANWYRHNGTGAPKISSNAEIAAATSHGNVTAGSEPGEVLVASNDSGDFTLLPDSMPPTSGDTTIVRVQMQRAALGELGLTVNEEHAADWIQVDLLVGDDGLPQAVRLPQTATDSSN